MGGDAVAQPRSTDRGGRKALVGDVTLANRPSRQPDISGVGSPMRIVVDRAIFVAGRLGRLNGINAHQAAQGVTSPRDARAHGAGRDTEDIGDLLIGEALHTDEKDRGSLLFGQPRKRPFEIAQFEAFVLIGRSAQCRLGVVDFDRSARAQVPPDLVDVLIVEDTEQPCAQIGALLPEMLLCEGAGKAILHEIVGVSDIADQHPCIARRRRGISASMSR